MLVKLGQIASTRTDVLPAATTEELAKLRADVRKVPEAEVREMLETELGEPVERAFGSFEFEPLAAASIGQTHRAVLADGTPVVVKVQRPGIDEVVARDAAVLRLATSQLERRVEAARAIRLRRLQRGADRRPRGGARLPPRGRGRHAAAREPRRRRRHRGAPGPREPLDRPRAGHGAGRRPPDRRPRGARRIAGPARRARPAPARVVHRPGARRRAVPRRPAPRQPAARRRRARSGCSTSARSGGSTRARSTACAGSRSASPRTSPAILARAARTLAGDDGFVDLRALETDMSVQLGALDEPGGLDPRVIGEVLAVMQRHGMRPPSSITLLARALITLEGTLRGIDPGLSLVKTSREVVMTDHRDAFGTPQELLQREALTRAPGPADAARARRDARQPAALRAAHRAHRALRRRRPRRGRRLGRPARDRADRRHERDRARRSCCSRPR